jgi:hypothetical protein
MMPEIVVITGGYRSGRSLAAAVARELSKLPDVTVVEKDIGDKIEGLSVENIFVDEFVDFKPKFYRRRGKGERKRDKANRWK